jgi:hypothetical protein
MLLRLISTTKIDIDEVKFRNVLPFVTENNKTPSRADFIKQGQNPSFRFLILYYDIVYVCGKMAKLAVDQIKDFGNTKIVYLPHPSPKNRQWNNPKLFTKVAKMIGDAYESKNAENGKGFETKRDLSDDRLRGDILSGETESICPVVKDFERRKKKDNDRGSAGMGGTYIRQGG